MVKDSIKYILQKSLGFKNYLYVFAMFKIKTLKNDSKEKDFFYFLELIKNTESHVLDIGANIGIMSYHLSKKLTNSTIHAFEPIPDNISVLNKIKTKFKLSNLKIYPFALGESKTKIQMILPQKNRVKFQGLSHVKHHSIKEMNDGIEFEVDQESLDNLFFDEKIQAIKIDVENYEFFVLNGAKNLISKNKPIIYAELWDNENRTKCFDFLNSLHYSTFVVEKNNLVSFNQDLHKKQNFIFIAN
jgi:FkbM family methyltransferase